MNNNLSNKGKFIKSPDFKNNVKKNIEDIGNFDLKGSYYNFLNKKTIYNLKNNKSYISLKSFGKRHILFLTKIKNKNGEKNYSIFINKKNDDFIICKLKFNESVFNGTLLDGELVKNNEGNWIFLIDDIPYYKGESIITSKLSDRYELLKNLIDNEYIEDPNINMCLIEYKKNYNLKKIQYLVDFQEK